MAAPGRTTVGETSIEVIEVPIIAVLDTRSGKAVAAAGEHTGRHTGISVRIIAIIAGFKSRHPLDEVEPANTIATAGDLTCIRAAITVVPVAVITAFIGIEDAVAAAFGSAKGRTSIPILLVAIITILETKVAGGKIPTDQTITA
tara:strand:- start:1204 stop:1638 length:435 start_codon:yes stop_codon:yes gene_type:complete